MKLTETDLLGLFHIEAKPHADDRGAFGRLYCEETFKSSGLDFRPVQSNLSTNKAEGTLRGLHFQNGQFAEEKLVHAVAGSAWDVSVDLRRGPTFGHWRAIELNALKMNAVFIPKGFAHGFITLEPNTSLLYHMGTSYVPDQATGIFWSDTDLAIDWPIPPRVISAADQILPNLKENYADLLKKLKLK